MQLLPDELFDKNHPEYKTWEKYKKIHTWLSNDWDRAIEAYEVSKGKSAWTYKSHSYEEVSRYFTVSYNYFYKLEQIHIS